MNFDTRGVSSAVLQGKIPTKWIFWRVLNSGSMDDPRIMGERKKVPTKLDREHIPKYLRRGRRWREASDVIGVALQSHYGVTAGHVPVFDQVVVSSGDYMCPILRELAGMHGTLVPLEKSKKIAAAKVEDLDVGLLPTRDEQLSVGSETAAIHHVFEAAYRALQIFALAIEYLYSGGITGGKVVRC
jgi:hypothetical protein